MPSEQDYQNHPVFAQLEHYISFYESLAYSVFSFIPGGTSAICNIDSNVYSSMQGTLASIHTILHAGKINDAYALLRKYYDAAIINIYSNLYLEDHFSIENFVVQHIENWLNGTDRLPEYRVMSQYIRTSHRVTPISEVIYGDERYKQLRDRCNDHTHYNFYYNLRLNDIEVDLSTRLKALDVFASDVRDVMILHVAYLFFAKEFYMASDDYIGCLDCGVTPEPDSQYWVAPFVQDFFDHVVTLYRPDIAARIRENTSMHLK